MGTRSITRIPGVCTMYRQFDGYPSGHGVELFQFLSGMTVVNGLSPADRRKVANGPECLAAQMLAHFKAEPGGIYLYAPTATDLGEDYEYIVDASDAGGIKVTVLSYGEQDFSGTVAEFGAFCNQPDGD